MLIVRSLLFKVCFVVLTLIEMVLFAPFYFFLPHKLAWIVPRSWCRSVLWLQKHIAGTTYRIEGVENLPQGACIIAAKHQSTWETLALTLYVSDPAFILKRELMWIPGLGWFLAKMGMIAINRGAPLKALKSIIAGAREKAAANRQIVIFPEGTRQTPGSAPDYKSGIFPVYAELGLPVIPVALNSGLYWPRQNVRCYPGVIRCRILPALKPGLPRKEFMNRLETAIETACDELLLTAADEPDPPAMPQAAIGRLKALGVNWTGPKRR